MRFLDRGKIRQAAWTEQLRARQAGLFIGPLEADCGE
jgi:hypothetical protein